MTDPARYGQNAKVLAYLGRAKPTALAFVWHREASVNAYYESGCHPDIVERIWDQIGATLPSDCRGLVCGTPALVHSVSGAVLAIGMGTQYGLRLSEPGLSAARAAGAKTTVTWTIGGSTDIVVECGADWVFGCFASDEPTWCRQAYEAFG
jgi:hypothetical protein